MTRVGDPILFTSINIESFFYLRPYIIKWLQAATRISLPTIVVQDHSANKQTQDAADQPQPLPTTPPAPPPGLKEISSLASWTVSSSKPGCGVQALRAPNTQLFWQSDGPQPHHLNIHFFKMVAIVGMRIYLDFYEDESYTPTLIRFAAGTGYADLQEFSVMRFEKPRGWLDVDFEGVASSLTDDESDQGDSEDGTARLSILRCMLVQVRICENHQNGKDTHLRGLQIFAQDEEISKRQRKELTSSIKVDAIGAELSIRAKRKVWEVPEWAEVPSLR